MRLKWLPVRLRRVSTGVRPGCADDFRASAAGRPTTDSALLRGAGQRQLLFSWPRRVPREGGSRAPRGERTARHLDVPEMATEESLRDLFRTLRRRLPPSRGWLGRSQPGRAAAVATACSGPADGLVRAGSGGRPHLAPCSRWCPNGRIRPVLKHGPRSATCVRVPGWQTRRRNESEGSAVPACCGESPHSPRPSSGRRGTGGASSTDPGLRCGGI